MSYACQLSEQTGAAPCGCPWVNMSLYETVYPYYIIECPHCGWCCTIYLHNILYGSWWVYTPLIYHSYSYLPWYSRCIILILCILHYVTTGIWREIRIWREGYHNRWWCNGNIHHIWKQCYIRITLWYYHYRMLFPQSIPWLSDIGNH